MDNNIEQMIKLVGMIAAVVLPFWNIPLILKIIKRRSSNDISAGWVVGVWVCTLLMVPSGIISADPVWRTYSIINIILFSGVVVVTLKYQK